MAGKKAHSNRNVCVACGECEYICPKSAISVNNGVFAVVVKERCIGCGLCKKSCPANCIDMIEGGEDEK